MCQTESMQLAIILTSQSYMLDLGPSRVFFFDFSKKCVGKLSFINRAKTLSELIPFEWQDLPRVKLIKRLSGSSAQLLDNSAKVNLTIISNL